MWDITTNLVAVVIVLGFLIFAHEAGHFFVAKLFKVRVLVFSFGFGRRLFGFRKGPTDYRVSLIPLGGYVRMAGDTPEDDNAGDPDEYLSKPKWQRFLILLAGPAMNIFIAISFVTGLSMIGTEFRIVKPIIGSVVPNKPAAKAGLQSGDRIVRIGDEPINDFDDLRLVITMNSGTPLRVEYIRNGQARVTTFTPERENSDFGPVGKAGIAPFYEPVVGRVIAGSPAANHGVQPGDRIISVNGAPVTDMVQVDQVIVKEPGAPITLGFQRPAKKFTVNFPKTKFSEQDPYQGFMSPTEVRKLSLVPAIRESFHQNLKMLRFAFSAIRRIFRSEGSVKELSGPISIARISGEMMRRSWMALIALMAMISLQLGVMNLLPIPVLDGGHIAILLVEGVVRRDLSLKAKERIQQLGFAVLAALMIVVIYNDLVVNVTRAVKNG
jgi:regulator of sigma E protease